MKIFISTPFITSTIQYQRYSVTDSSTSPPLPPMSLTSYFCYDKNLQLLQIEVSCFLHFLFQKNRHKVEEPSKNPKELSTFFLD